MSERVRIHQLAKEMGVPSQELIRVAQTLGMPLKAHSSTLDRRTAESLKAALQGMALASMANQQVHAAPDTAQASYAVAKPKDQEALMLVNMIKHDVRVSDDYTTGFNNMLKVVAALLSDFRQTVRTANRTVSWGELYFLRADRSTSLRGTIELEYGDERLGFSQRQRSVLGDLWWSANWLNEDWTRPLLKLGQVIGLVRDPEADFRNQMESDMRALEAQGLIVGLDEWEIDTGIPGRNLYITPREEFLPQEEE